MPSDRRKILHKKLEAALAGTKVWFQPPSNISMTYPTVIYHMEGSNNTHADNSTYTKDVRYSVVVMDTNPDSTLWSSIMDAIPRSSLDNVMNVEGLYHWNITLYD